MNVILTQPVYEVTYKGREPVVFIVRGWELRSDIGRIFHVSVGTHDPLVADFSPRRTGFASRVVLVGFVVDTLYCNSPPPPEEFYFCFSRQYHPAAAPYVLMCRLGDG